MPSSVVVRQCRWQVAERWKPGEWTGGEGSMREWWMDEEEMVEWRGKGRGKGGNGRGAGLSKKNVLVYYVRQPFFFLFFFCWVCFAAQKHPLTSICNKY